MKPALHALVLVLALAAPLAAASGGGSTSSQSLRLARGARAVSLGGAYTALASGAEAMAWNPAGMNSVRALQATASHLSYIEGISDDTLQIALPIYGMGAWGLGLDYLYASDQGYDNWGAETGAFNIYDFSAQVGLSLELPWDMHLGAVYKTLRQGYGAQHSMGSAFDFGWQWKGLFKRLDLGAVMGNLGTPMALGKGFGILPVTYKVGAVLNLTDSWLFSADFDHQAADFFNKVRLGTELNAKAGSFRLSGRGGYVIGPEQDLGGLAGMALGVGVGRGKWQLDYAWQPLGDLGTTHRVSATFSSWMY